MEKDHLPKFLLYLVHRRLPHRSYRQHMKWCYALWHLLPGAVRMIEGWSRPPETSWLLLMILLNLWPTMTGGSRSSTKRDPDLLIPPSGPLVLCILAQSAALWLSLNPASQFSLPGPPTTTPAAPASLPRPSKSFRWWPIASDKPHHNPHSQGDWQPSLPNYVLCHSLPWVTPYTGKSLVEQTWSSPDWQTGRS